jgi:hypothetical protein
VAAKFFAAVVEQARAAHLMSHDHFTVDGTLIEAMASLKSFVAGARCTCRQLQVLRPRRVAALMRRRSPDALLADRRCVTEGERYGESARCAWFASALMRAPSATALAAVVEWCAAIRLR